MQKMLNRKRNIPRNRFKVILVILVLLLISNLYFITIIPRASANAPPSGVILLEPANNTFLNTSTPTLEWYPSFDPEGQQVRYEIEIDNASGDWSSLVRFKFTGYNTTNWSVTPPLPDGSYQWRVRANDTNITNATGAWSEVWFFTVDTTPPSILNGTGDLSTHMGDPFTIFANFTDNTNVTGAIIYYKKLVDSIYLHQPMPEHQGLDQFYITNYLLGINTTDDDDDYSYYIIAHDIVLNTFNYSKMGGLDFRITVIDNIPPDFVNGTGSFSVTTDDEFSIHIHCIDNIGIADAALFIRKEQAPWQSLKLNKYHLNGYFIINYSDLKSELGFNTSDGINCEYYILVRDKSNNVYNYSNSPGWPGPTYLPWVIEVIDNDKPEVIGGSGNIFATTSDQFLIFANFTDNVGVTNAILYFKNVVEQNTAWHAIDLLKGSTYNFYINYENLKSHPVLQLNTSSGGYYEYYVLATDLAKNMCNYTSTQNQTWKIIIEDDDSPELIHGSGNFQVTTDDPFDIYVRLIDNVEVQSAKLFIREVQKIASGDTPKDLAGVWYQSWMNKEILDEVVHFAKSYYELKLEFGIDSSRGSKLEYYILAFDSVGNIYNYSGRPNNFWVITVVDNDPPIVLNGTRDLMITTGQDFVIHAEFYDNIEVSTATIFYGPVESSNDTIPESWLIHDFVFKESTTSDFGLEVYRLEVTNQILDIDTVYSDLDYFYYIVAYDGTGNSVNSGSEEKPHRITITDTAAPSINSLTTAPKNLTSDYDDDFIISAIVNDIGGSGLYNQSVTIRYKRGSFDSTFIDYTVFTSFCHVSFARRVGVTSGFFGASIAELSFTIPKPESDFVISGEDMSVGNGWELIAGENIIFELRCVDLEGNIFESGQYIEYVDPVFINHAPEIQLITPAGNDTLSGLQNIYWLATDSDDDELFISILLSEDLGATWVVLTSGLQNNGTYLWNTTRFRNNDKYMLKLIASDSELNSYDVSDAAFMIHNIPPRDNDEPVEEVPKQKDPVQTGILPLIIIGVILAMIISSSLFIGGTEVGKFKFLTLILVPLYTKLHHDEILDHFIRGQIYGYIKANPGEHYNAIKESLELNNGTLSYHLKVLEKEEYIYSKRDKFYTRFYPKGMMISPVDAAQLTKFQKIILNKVRLQPGISQQEIITQLGSSQQVISYNLTKLVRDEVLRMDKKGRNKLYFVNHTDLSLLAPADDDNGPLGPSQSSKIDPEDANILTSKTETNGRNKN